MGSKSLVSEQMRQLLHLISLIIIFVGLALDGSAQSGMRFSHFSVREGLSQNTINAIYEDESGFIWFGTQDGLNRFDGNSFASWPLSPLQDALSDNFVLSIAESEERNLYVGTRNGLNRINRDRSAVELIELPGTQSSSFHNVVDLLMSFQDKVIARSSGRLFLIDEGNDEVNVSALNLGEVSAINCYEHEIVGVRNSNRLFTWDGQTIEEHATIPATGLARGVYTDGERIYSWSKEELIVQDCVTCHPEVISVDFEIQALHSGNDLIWIASDQGLYTLERSTVSRVKPVNPVSEGLKKDFVRCLSSDRNGGVWVGSTRFGAFRHDVRSKYLPVIQGKHLADPIVWSAHCEENTLFVGSTGGLDLFEVTDELFHASYSPESSFKPMGRWEIGHVSSIVSFNDHVVIGTRDHQLRFFEKGPAGWQVNEAKSTDTGSIIYKLTVMDDSKLIISCAHYTLIIDDHGNADTLRLAELSGKNIANYSHHVFAENDTLWLSTMTGFHRYELQQGEVSLFGPGFGNRSIDYPFASCASRKSHFVLGTMGDGLRLLNHAGDSVLKSVKSELENGVIYGIVEKEEGIYTSTNSGLSRVDPNSLRVQNLNPTVGLPFGEHSQNAYGEINGLPWFGGIDGLYFVHPEAFSTGHHDCEPVVTEVLVNYKLLHPAGRQRIKGPLDQLEALILYPGDNSLTLDVAIPGIFARPTPIQYRLLGLNDEWIKLKHQGERINFTTLRGGEYRLQIAIAANEPPIEVSREIQIKVIPPFWETYWFLTAMIMLIAGGVYLIVRTVARRKLRNEVVKRQALERIRRERERISMDLHDNIGSQITHVITSLDNLSFKIANGKSEKPSEALDDLSDFARETMQQLRDTIWTLAQKEISVTDFARRIRDHLSRLLSDRDKPIYAVSCDENESLILAPNQAVQLFRVIQEAVNNALKYADAEQIEITFERSGAQLKVVIRDNGKGFIQLEQKDFNQGFGIKNMRTRIESMQGVFELLSVIGQGTVIKIELPVDSDHTVL